MGDVLTFDSRGTSRSVPFAVGALAPLRGAEDPKP